MFENFRFRLFIKFLAFYICIFLIPFLIFASLVSRYTMTKYKDETMELSFNNINYIRYVIDGNLSDVELMQIQIAENWELMDLVTEHGMTDSEKAVAGKEVAKEISKYRRYKGAVLKLDLYSAAMDSIITNSSNYSKEEYYQYFLADSGFSFEEWESRLNGTDNSTEPMRINTDGRSTAMLIRPISNGVNGEEVTVMVVLDAGEIADAYQRMFTLAESSYFAITSDNNILIESGEAPIELNPAELLSKKEDRILLPGGYTALCSTSINSNLNYICILSDAEVLSSVRKTNLVVIISVILILILLVLLALVFSNKTFSPMKELLSIGFSERSYQIENIGDFKDLVVNLVNSNDTLREVVSRQKNCINENVYRLFLQDSMEMDDSTIEELFADTAVTQNAESYSAAVIVSLDGSGKIDEMVSLAILSGLRETLKNYDIKFGVIPNNDNNRVLILTGNKAESVVRIALQEFVVEAERRHNIRLSVGLGRSLTSIKDFSKSYEDAVFALKPGHCGVFVFKNSGDVSYSRYFKPEEKDKLVLGVLRGSVDVIRNAFAELCDRFFMKYTMTYRTQNYLKYQFGGILREAVENISDKDGVLAGLTEKCAKAVENHRFNESIEIIRECFEQAAIYVNKQSEKEKNTTISEVLDYLSEHYEQADISLKLVSDELNLSYKYLSDALKKQTGRNFLEHLHNLRNQKARELLADTDMSVAQIAEAIGYLSSNTFIKTFKKLNGITPGEFRRINNL